VQIRFDVLVGCQAEELQMGLVDRQPLGVPSIDHLFSNPFFEQR